MITFWFIEKTAIKIVWTLSGLSNKQLQIEIKKTRYSSGIYFLKLGIKDNCNKNKTRLKTIDSLFPTCINYFHYLIIIFKNICCTYLSGDLFLGGLQEDFLGQGQVYLRLLATVQTLPWIFGYLDNSFVPSPCRELGLFTVIWIQRVRN